MSAVVGFMALPHSRDMLTVSSLPKIRRTAGRARTAARSSRATTKAKLEPDNCSIFVAGGGGVAYELVRKLQTAGAWVMAFNRTDVRRKEIEAMGSMLAIGDALDVPSIDKGLGTTEFDVVVSTVGGTPQDPTADSQGNVNIIEAAERAGVKKFVLVTSVGVGDSKDAAPQQVYEVLKPVLLEKAKAEERLKSSTMQWVIVRPGGLKSEPATGKGEVTADNKVCGAIHREDVAEVVFKCIFSEKANGQVLSALDRDQVFGEQANFEAFAL